MLAEMAHPKAKTRRVNAQLPAFSLPKDVLFRLWNADRSEVQPLNLELAAAVRRRIDAIDRGERLPVQPSDPKILELIVAEDRCRQAAFHLSRRTELGPFLAEFYRATNPDRSEIERIDALDRLLKESLGLRGQDRSRLSAALKRARRAGVNVIWRDVVTSAIALAVMEARGPVPSLRVVPGPVKKLKSTSTADGSPLVPSHHLSEAQLRSWLRTRVKALVDEDLGARHGKETSFDEVLLKERGLRTGMERDSFLSRDDRRRMQVRILEEQGELGANGQLLSGDANLWRVGDVESHRYSTLGNGAALHGVGALSAPKGADRIGAGWYLVNGRPRLVGFVPSALSRGGDPVSLDAIAAGSIARLEALEYEEATAPLRLLKLEEIRALATPEQRRLIEVLLETEVSEWADLATHLRKSPGAVGQLVMQLRIKADAAGVEPPGWVKRAWWDSPVTRLWNDGPLARPRDHERGDAA